MTQSNSNLPRATLRQIQRLEPNRNYAIVFNHPITPDQLKQLIEVCKGASIHAVVLVNAQVVPLDQAIMLLSQNQLTATIEHLTSESLANVLPMGEEKEKLEDEY